MQLPTAFDLHAQPSALGPSRTFVSTRLLLDLGTANDSPHDHSTGLENINKTFYRKSIYGAETMESLDGLPRLQRYLSDNLEGIVGCIGDPSAQSTPVRRFLFMGKILISALLFMCLHLYAV